MSKMVQINIPAETGPSQDVIDGIASLLVKVADHRKKKLWGRISIELLIEEGSPSKITVSTSEVYSERDIARNKLKPVSA